MTAAAVAVPRAATRTRAADVFFLATFCCVTFETVHWNIAGSVGIADILTILFLVSVALTSRGPTPRTTGIVLGFLLAFLIVYLLGFFNLEMRKRRFNRMVEPNMARQPGSMFASEGNEERGVKSVHTRRMA